MSNVQCAPGVLPQCVNGAPICGGNTSPILISWDGSPIQLTSAADGKYWTFLPDNPPFQIAWIDPTSTAAFLVLDRNGNGIIDNATEMFGNLTAQPPSATPNGFLALKMFDLNNDGVIDAKDAVFSNLQLWRADGGLHSLAEYGVTSISLNSSPADRTDQNGNRGEFKSIVTTGI